MSWLGIDHVQLAMPAREEVKARLFYAGVLQLTELPKPADLAARGGAWFQCGDVQLHLGVEQEFRPAKKAHPGLLVSDLEELKHRLVANKIEISFDAPISGFDRIFVADPFGNRLEFLQRL